MLELIFFGLIGLVFGWGWALTVFIGMVLLFIILEN